MNKELTLNDIPAGKSCAIVKVNGYGGFRHRILEMGFIKGAHVEVIKNAPLEDPVEYKILDSHVSLRRSEAKQIEVVDISDYNTEYEDFFGGTIDEEAEPIIHSDTKTINVALVGNPNCGKTSFFNFATGAHEKVGNYGGVTVGAKVGVFKRKGYTVNLVDLPGTYSITEYSPEELYVRQQLLDESPDVVLNVLDASNLERNLFLTTQIIDMNFKTVAALNMFDEFETSGNQLDYKYLGEMLGIPFVPTVAYKGTGINEVIDTIIDVYEDKNKTAKHIHINYGNTIENSLDKIKQKLRVNKTIDDKYHLHYIALKLLQNEAITIDFIKKIANNFEDIQKVTESEQKVVFSEYKEDIETVITNLKYGFIRGALKETFVSTKVIKEVDKTTKIDNILTNKWLGFPILILFLYIMFQATFTLGAYPQDWIEMGVEQLGTLISENIPSGLLNDFLVDGVIAGVGGVIVFLPNILILFFFISLMEDTGYMARATFILDKLMHKIGLHGRSFIPLLTGFGCSVPAIMSCRTLENKKDRILTMLIISFMSCSAKLPVYLLLVAVFFTKYQGLVLLSIYLIGMLIAIIVALLLKNTVFRKESEQFVLELPPYRKPTIRNTSMHMWAKSVQYLKKMGSVILIASAIIWFLSYFPTQDAEILKYDEQIAQLETEKAGNEEAVNSQIEELVLERNAVHQKQSYIGKIGRFVAPVVEPLGFDWKMSVCILTGFAAKETAVSTMGILYHSEDEEDSLIEKIHEEKYTEGNKKGEKVFTPLVGFSFIIFVLLYSPCVAAVVACRKEFNRFWAIVLAVYTTAVAWLVSFLVYQIGSLF